MKKFFICFVALFTLSGCFGQASVKKPSDPTESWVSGTEKIATADGISEGERTARVEVREATTVETKVVTAPASKHEPEPRPAPQPAAKSAPAPAPAPTPVAETRAPTAPTLTGVPLGTPGSPSVGTGVILPGQTRTRVFGPAYRVAIPDYTREVCNDSRADMQISSTGTVPFHVVVDQGVDLIDGPQMDSPFVEKMTPSGGRVYLLRAGHCASYVVGIERCQNGGECKIRLQAVKFSSTHPYARGDYTRPSVRTWDFPYYGNLPIRIR